jgi:hypothetical protein
MMPYNLSLNMWEALMAIMLVQNAVYIPMKISYTTTTSTLVGLLDLGVDACFILDVVIMFFAAIKINGMTYTDRGFIAKHYIKGHFMIDLFLALPI